MRTTAALDLSSLPPDRTVEIKLRLDVRAVMLLRHPQSPRSK